MTARTHAPYTRPQQRRRQAGFTLVELMMVVFIISVLSALIGTAYMRNVKRSRTTEAAGHLQKMWVGSIAYYETDHALTNGQMASKQFPGNCASYTVVEPDCCTSPTERCPGSDPVYLTELWRAIQFNIADEHLYVPRFKACPEDNKHLHLEVRGDLNCNALHSTFIRLANVGASGDIEGYNTPAVLFETE
jgi:prepilin-type N-terminal cleavage/methylation domain-containing protein